MAFHPLLAQLHARSIARRPKAAARALARFAKAERGSMLTLIWAATHVDSPERRATYLEQAYEEQRHGRMFSKRAAELNGYASSEPSVNTDAEDLFIALGEIRMLAFLYRGEHRAVVEFSGYRDAFRKAGDAKTAALFAEIVEEERHHQEYPLELIQSLTNDPRAVTRASRYVAAWEAWRTMRRLGQFMAGLLYTGGMTCLYALLLPLSLWVRWVRPEVRGLVLAREWSRNDRSQERG